MSLVINTILDNKIASWEQKLNTYQSDTIFKEVPVPLDEFLYGKQYLNITKLSPIQYEFIKHGTQIYNDTELEQLNWDKVRNVGELVAFWGKSCFTGDTKVSLMNGQELSFEQLLNEYKDRKFWVYSFDTEKGIVPGLASNPRITKFVSELIEVTLDNGEIIKCTPEHLFMLRDGTYKEAQNLDIGQSLMPLYRKSSNKVLVDYEMHFEPIDNKWVYTHRKTGSFINDFNLVTKRTIRHHINFNKKDNSPDNIQLMPKEEHDRFHMKHGQRAKLQARKAIQVKIEKLKSDPVYRENYCRIIKASRTPDVIKSISEGVRRVVNNPEFKKKFCIKMHEICSSTEYRLKMSVSQKKRYADKKGIPAFESWKRWRNSRANGSEANAKRRETWKRKSEAKLLNHKITSIKKIVLDDPIPVYDITVEKYSNFALSSGVFVHNSGKDMCSVVIQARVAYLLLCLYSPQKYYNLMHTSSIDMLNMAYSADQAEGVFFETFAETLRQCSWFNDKCKIGARVIEFDKRIYAYSGNSFEEAFEGKNLIIAVLDEISAFKTKAEVEQMSMRRLRAPRYSAESVYDMAKSSVESRFSNGVGKVISLSFSRFKNDFIQQLFEAGKDEDTCYVSKGATWEVNPYKKKEDFADEFRKNPERAEARYACNPLGVEGGYFKNKNAIIRALPIIPEELVPSTNDIFPQLKSWFTCNHSFQCSIHIDLGLKKDKAGICVSHVSRLIDSIVKNEGGESTIVKLPYVEVDLLTSFIAPFNGEIDFSLIRQMIVDLVNRRFLIGKLTADSWQSSDFLQIISKMGIETDVRSVDRNTEAYDTLKELIYEDRLKGYSYIRTIETGNGISIQSNEIIDELNQLIFTGRKIDHVQYYGKDVSDALSGSVQGAIELGLSSFSTNDIVEGETRESVLVGDYQNDREYLDRPRDTYFS